MNIITIMSDSLRYDHVGCNGNDWIRTPNLDRFAYEHAVVFDNAYCGSFPTIPNRTDIHCGYWTMLRRGWSPLSKDDYTLSSHLSKNGLRTMHIWDTPHINGANMQMGFNGWKWNRGQEGDGFEIAGDDIPRHDKEKCHSHLVKSHFTNHKFRKFEQDYASPMTFNAAEKWLEHNYNKGDFLLSIDTFDPHEPWDPPEYYTNRYDKEYDGHDPIYIPWYQFCDNWTEAQIRHTRAMYAGEVTMVDHAFGRFLTKIEDMGLLENTMIIFMSDHGHLLSEHGRFGKSNRDSRIFIEEDKRYEEPWALYRDITHLNMMIHLPGTEAGRTDALMQPVDLFPTICDACSIEKPDTLEGKSLIPVLSGETKQHRETVITSPYSIGNSSAITDGRWVLHVMKDGEENLLFDLENDPNEENNIIADNKDEAERLKKSITAELNLTEFPV